MENQESTAYIWYLRSVLGTQQYINPINENYSTKEIEIASAKPSPENSGLPATSALDRAPETVKKILFYDDQAWETGAQLLFEKMREAMNLGSEEVQVITGKKLNFKELEFQKILFSQIVIFTSSVDEIESSREKLDSRQISMTISPRVLLRQPELKRRAWEDLKLVMQRL